MGCMRSYYDYDTNSLGRLLLKEQLESNVGNLLNTSNLCIHCTNAGGVLRIAGSAILVIRIMLFVHCGCGFTWFGGPGDTLFKMD